MAKKISQLTQATEVKSDDVTVIVQDGETKKLPLNMMVTKQDIENKKVAGLAKLDEIEATYENDTYAPTITVKNKSSVKTGEGDEVDYSANVMDGHVKSAILKGQTLVNLVTQKSGSFNGTRFLRIPLSYTLKTNAKYFVKFNVRESSLTNGVTCRLKNDTNGGVVGSLKSDGIITVTDEGYNYIEFYISNADDVTNGLDAVVDDIMLIEYQDDMENWDIPYFEGMQSVKMPVLKATGKNLFGGSLIATSDARRFELKGLELVEGEKYALSYNCSKDGTKTHQLQYMTNSTANPTYLSAATTNTSEYKLYFTVPKDLARLFIYTNDWNSSLEHFSNIQIEQGIQTTSYEPFKSNILTVNEDVELRGIGDVQDTLDCLTGEVTKRVLEYSITGDEGWVKHATTNTFFTMDGIVKYSDNKRNVISDKFIGKYVPSNTWLVNMEICVFGSKIGIGFDGTLEELIEYLKLNNPRIFYVDEEKSVKTVDLMPSGTHPSTTPYCWKNGHIQLSSSGLLPNLEYSVVTSRAGQINQNATMVVKNDKRIFDLEILLAGGLVNTTYQALTLQNQVETGLSKVSLSSETEPDYLLYHMIMKLIEEKAYKLDDLTEKVSVFYLYEKLSDEQFETIYSALYPFVEDEIVEEPVVEELPEVVEDEVIM